MFLGCHRRAWHVSFPITGTEAHLLHIHQTSMFHVKHCNLRPCAMFHVKHCDSQTHSKKMRGARQVICRFQSIANLSPKFNPSFKGTRRGGNTPREGSFWIHAANIGVPDAERWRASVSTPPAQRHLSLCIHDHHGVFASPSHPRPCSPRGARAPPWSAPPVGRHPPSESRSREHHSDSASSSPW